MGVLLSMVDEHREAVAVTLRNAQKLLNESTLDAVRLLGDVVRNPCAKDSDRIKAANIILDRVLGKTPEHITVDVHEPPWAMAIRDMYRTQGPLQVGPGDVIDAEVVEDDPIFADEP